MLFEVLEDADAARKIFVQASLTNEFNSKNYTQDQFEKSWNKWLKFFVMYEAGDPVMFCGIRDYGEYARIFDRYFVFPKYRRHGLRNNEYCKMIVQDMVDNTDRRIPFFSMEFAKRRRVVSHAIESCNEELPTGQRFHLLPGLYETAPNSWQNIAIQQPHTFIDLNYKSL